MNPEILPLPFEAAKLRGLSERLLQSHHQNNYGGAVKRLHAIRAEVVVYCVYGHEVGQSSAARLRHAGISARFLIGGIEDWKKAGRPILPKT